MEKLKNFREGLFASASHLSADQVSLFEPFVCHGNPFNADIFFIGTNGVLDDINRPMLKFNSYWSDSSGFDFKTWHRDLANLPGGLSKTRQMADDAIKVLKKYNLDQKVLSTNVYSTGSPNLRMLRRDHRVVAPFKFLMRTLNPKVLFVFGKEARKVFMELWEAQITFEPSAVAKAEIFTLRLNGKVIKGLFTPHLSMHVGNNDVTAFAELIAAMYSDKAVEQVGASNASYISPKPESKQTTPSDTHLRTEMKGTQTVTSFELAYEKLISELKRNQKVHVRGHNDNYYTIIELNGGVAVERESGNHKKLSVKAMKDLFETGKHVAQRAKFTCTLSNAHNYGDLRYCAAVVNYMKAQ
jgi:hypothetical protein